VRIATGFGAQEGYDVIRDAIPLDVEAGGAWVEEEEPSGVLWVRRVVEVI
jgi:hypothetical protein